VSAVRQGKINMINAVFFDVGGTLVDFPNMFQYFAEIIGEGKTEIEQYMMDEFLSEYNKIGNEESFFRSVEEILTTVLSQASKVFDIYDISDDCGYHYTHLATELSQLYPDTVPILDYFKNQNIALYVASDADAPLLYRQLQQLDIFSFFNGFIISSEVQAYKPSNKFVEASSKYVSIPDCCLFVGDSEVDVKTGKKLGVKTVHKKDITKNPHSADFTISQLSQLIELIDV
jgi:HAD superfamily hydrolase (TIGR01509 family)